MAETVTGGVYKDATGNGYHDANGKPVDAETVREAQKLQREQSEQKTAMFAPIADRNATNNDLVGALRDALVGRNQPATQAADVATGGDLTAETERRARGRQG